MTGIAPMTPPPYIYASTLSRRERSWRGRRRRTGPGGLVMALAAGASLAGALLGHLL